MTEKWHGDNKRIFGKKLKMLIGAGIIVKLDLVDKIIRIYGRYRSCKERPTRYAC